MSCSDNRVMLGVSSQLVSCCVLFRCVTIPSSPAALFLLICGANKVLVKKKLDCSGDYVAF